MCKGQRMDSVMTRLVAERPVGRSLQSKKDLWCRFELWRGRWYYSKHKWFQIEQERLLLLEILCLTHHQRSFLLAILSHVTVCVFLLVITSYPLRTVPHYSPPPITLRNSKFLSLCYTQQIPLALRISQRAPPVFLAYPNWPVWCSSGETSI